MNDPLDPGAAEAAETSPSHPPPSEEGLVREPLQARSRRTLERLVAAAARLLEDQGADGVTVTGVSRAARTSVGAFYARFSGKEEMVRYLGERWLGEAVDRWAEVEPQLEEGSPEGLRAALTELATLYLHGPARRLVLLAGQDDPPPARLRRFEDRVASSLARGAGAAPNPSGPSSDSSGATRFLRATALVAGLRELGTRASEGGGPSAGLGPGALAETMVTLAAPLLHPTELPLAPSEPSSRPVPEVEVALPDGPQAEEAPGATDAQEAPPSEEMEERSEGEPHRPQHGEEALAEEGEALPAEEEDDPAEEEEEPAAEEEQEPEEEEEPAEGEDEPEIFDVWG